MIVCFFFSSRRRHTRCSRDWSSDVCSSDLRKKLSPIVELESAGTVRARFSNVNSARSGDHVITGGVSTAGPGVILKSTLLSWKPSPETGAAYHQFKSHAFQPGWTTVGSKYEPSPTSFPVIR